MTITTRVIVAQGFNFGYIYIFILPKTILGYEIVIFIHGKTCKIKQYKFCNYFSCS